MSYAAKRHKGMSEDDVQALCNPVHPNRPPFNFGFAGVLRRLLESVPASWMQRHNVWLQEGAQSTRATDTTRAFSWGDSN